MKYILSFVLLVLLAACAGYPDISGLSPQAALAQLDSFESELDEGEQQIRADMNGSTGPVPAGGFIALGEAMAPAMNQMALDNIAQYRRQVASDREVIYRANPSLRPASSVTRGGNARAQASGGGSCILPASAVTDAKRRQTFAIATNAPTFPNAFQTLSELRREVASTGGATCS
ncbi:MAG: hypothetical protein AAF386_11660, partial [Pseudomonadota bacterium]